ncbi:MAG TPA: glycosyltransferase family 39 protein [Bryobacteraceae bacterium]|nr:glycosyltransferase family 39 protein [Bryobacteraceae bacterium]
MRARGQYYLAPGALIFAYLLICFAFAVGTAGLEDDEAVSFRQSAALAQHAPMQCLGSYDLRLGHICLPIMLAPYVGASKDYVLLPLFAIAGFHVGVARMGAALLAACGIFGAWVFMKRFFGPMPAAVSAGFLALNPSYIDLPLFDQGNIAFSLGILGFLLVAVTRVVDRPSRGRFFTLGLLIGIGTWGRLNFAWLALAAGVAVMIVFRRELGSMLRYAPWLIAGSLAGAAPLIRFLLRRSGDLKSFMETSAVPQTFSQTLHSVLVSLWDVMLASAEHRVTIWRAGPIPAGLSTAMLALSAMAVAWCLFQRSKAARAVALTILVLLAVYVGSQLPVASHHMVIFVFLVALALGTASSGLTKKAGRIAIGLLCFAYAITAATIDFDSASRLHRTRGYGEWSAGIYPLVAYLQSHPDSNGLYMLDWGFAHSTYVLSKGRLPSTDLYTRPDSRGGENVDWPRRLHDGGTFVTYATDILHFPEATLSFEHELELSKRPFTKTSFQERDGTAYAHVLVVPRSPASEEPLRIPDARRTTTFLASPSEIAGDANGLGQTTLLFWTDKSTFVEIHVGAPDGPMLGQFRSRGVTSGVSKTGSWVSDGMTFYLQDVAGKPLVPQYTLATVKVSVKTAR